ncbi:MAG: hypothetical protein MUO72_02370 [Bacteroidales bacterium]|nr:hypothetical protein [Bacteroidales bacterium]
MKRTLVSFTILFLIFSASFGQTPEKKRYKATEVTTAPLIDGVVDDQVWDGNWRWRNR